MISFILTVLNKPHLLADFFIHMPGQTGEHEWVVVDNGSNGTMAGVLSQVEKRPNTVVIRNKENMGFGPGNNQGAVIAKGDILCFTQPDVRFLDDVTPILAALNDKTLWGHRLLDFDTGWNKFGSIIVPYLEGYFLACTRSTWLMLGGFDPKYHPADFEDVDLSWGALDKGVHLGVKPFPVEHRSFGSTWAQFDNRREVTLKNRGYFAQKWGLSL